jgi:hypothetical protein
MRFFKTDGDGIFTGGEAVELYEKYNIRHVQSAPGDSASNDVAERTIRTFAELTRSNLLHAGAPPNLWAEAMALVGYVWNHIATMPSTTIPGSYLSHTSILEGHSRKFDLSNLRAFGTKCYFMLTVQKKGGAKAKLGAIVGIEDNMPAYRVFDFEQRDKPKKIPFAQVVTHEGLNGQSRRKSYQSLSFLLWNLTTTIPSGADSSSSPRTCVNWNQAIRTNPRFSRIFPPWADCPTCRHWKLAKNFNQKLT